MNERDVLVDYVRCGKLMQLATLDKAGNPWMCNVWYASSFLPDSLYFVSRPTREHSGHIHANPHVAGSIVTIALDGFGQTVQGVTFTAHATDLTGDDTATTIFTRRWPAAAAGIADMKLFELQITEWILFDELNYPDEPRRPIPSR